VVRVVRVARRPTGDARERNEWSERGQLSNNDRNGINARRIGAWEIERQRLTLSRRGSVPDHRRIACPHSRPFTRHARFLMAALSAHHSCPNLLPRFRWFALPVGGLAPISRTRTIPWRWLRGHDINNSPRLLSTGTRGGITRAWNTGCKSVKCDSLKTMACMSLYLLRGFHRYYTPGKSPYRVEDS
jgi:hypothetical protein